MPVAPFQKVSSCLRARSNWILSSIRGDSVRMFYCSLATFDFGVEGASTSAATAALAASAGNTVTRSSLSFTTLGLTLRGGLLIPFAQRIWLVFVLMDAS